MEMMKSEYARHVLYKIIERTFICRRDNHIPRDVVQKVIRFGRKVTVQISKGSEKREVLFFDQMKNDVERFERRAKAHNKESQWVWVEVLYQMSFLYQAH